MKPRQFVMGAALLLAAGLAFFADKTPASHADDEVVEAAPRSKPISTAFSAKNNQVAAPIILAVLSRSTLIRETGDGKLTGVKVEAEAISTGVFLSQSWAPPPPKAIAPAKPAAPPPPIAPPLPFTFIGKAASDGAWQVFLARADQTYIVRNKTVIDGTYRIDSIVPPLMTMTYLPLNQAQQINIGVLD